MDSEPKDMARREVSRRLSQLSSDEFDELSDLVYKNICGLISQLQEDKPISTILSYRAVAGWHEVGLGRLGSKFPSVSFDYVEASPSAPFPTSHYDAVLVPLLGFNSEGYRLGHGGGWYDRFFASYPNVIKIGVGLEAGLVEFGAESHDIPMDYIVTERHAQGTKEI